MNVCNFFAENFCMQLFSSYLPKMHKGSELHFSERIHHFQDASLSFGRPGAGAPVRTKSGRLRSTVVGNPEIRSSSTLSSSLWSPLSSALSPSPIIIIITIVHWCISNPWICLKSDFQTVGSKSEEWLWNRRFQANEGVQKSIYNNIRYAVPAQEKSIYHAELGERWRRELIVKCCFWTRAVNEI